MIILITAGGTTEKIDDVRAISNNSTGRLGTAIAEAFLNSDKISIEKILYVCGQNAVVPASDKVEAIRISGVAQLASVMEEILTSQRIDVVVHSMAVSDYGVDSVTTRSNIRETVERYLTETADKYRDFSPENLASGITDYIFNNSAISNENKLSSDINDLVINLKKTPKIIGMIKRLQPETILVGFKLLSNSSPEELIDIGYGLLQRNSCEMVLANDLSRITEDRHTGHLIFKDKTFETFETKAQIADAIAAHTVELLKNKGRA
ncbi:MAG TPA: phosphopantothenate--cysteine ligase [Ruminiclostridium sp.]|nr:phosphopantothenate--cysteine ligase [Ruminiclostridium sp.]